jgi:hypothetical protein
MLFIFSTPVIIRHLWQLKTVFFCIGVSYRLFYCPKILVKFVGEIVHSVTPQKCPPLLALATLGDATPIGLFIFSVPLPNVTKASTVVAVMCQCHQHFCLDFYNKLCQSKHTLRLSIFNSVIIHTHALWVRYHEGSCDFQVRFI